VKFGLAYIIFPLFIFVFQNAFTYEGPGNAYCIPVYVQAPRAYVPPAQHSLNMQISCGMPVHTTQIMTLPAECTTSSTSSIVPSKQLMKYSTEKLRTYFAQQDLTEHQILIMRTLYLNPAFVVLVKSFAGYESYIERLHHHLQNMWFSEKLWERIWGTHPVMATSYNKLCIRSASIYYSTRQNFP
jgi:hypothetical protein